VPAPALRELQAAFWRHLAAHPDDDPGRPIAPELAAALVGTDELAADARLAIYARMYLWRLLDVLRDDHPRTAAVLGDESEARRIDRAARDDPRLDDELDPLPVNGGDLDRRVLGHRLHTRSLLGRG